MPTPPLCCLRFLLFKISAVSRDCRAWCFETSKMLLGILAVNLDLPLCVFLLDASETNYSGFRGAIDQARQGWREIQSWMMGSFHRPVYEWKVRQWAVTDNRFGRSRAHSHRGPEPR